MVIITINKNLTNTDDNDHSGGVLHRIRNRPTENMRKIMVEKIDEEESRQCDLINQSRGVNRWRGKEA